MKKLLIPITILLLAGCSEDTQKDGPVQVNANDIIYDRDLKNTIKYECDRELTKAQWKAISRDGVKEPAKCAAWINTDRAIELERVKHADFYNSTDSWLVGEYDFKALSEDKEQLGRYKTQCKGTLPDDQIMALHKAAYLYPNIPKECVLYVKAKDSLGGMYLPKLDLMKAQPIPEKKPIKSKNPWRGNKDDWKSFL